MKRLVLLLAVLAVIPSCTKETPVAVTATTATVADREGDDPPTGEPTIMPNVANKDVVDAVRELQAAGLKVSVTFVSYEGVPYGVTTPTDDHPGETVHKGEYVLLGVSVRDPEKVEHFQLSDADEAQLSDAAAARLREIVAANK